MSKTFNLPLNRVTKQILEGMTQNGESYCTIYNAVTKFRMEGGEMPKGLEEVMSEDFFKHNADAISKWVGKKAAKLRLSDSYNQQNPYSNFSHFGDLQWDSSDVMVLWENNKNIVSCFYFLHTLESLVKHEKNTLFAQLWSDTKTTNLLERFVIDTINKNADCHEGGVTGFLNSIADCESPPSIVFADDDFVEYHLNGWCDVFAQYVLEIDKHVNRSGSIFYKHIIDTNKEWMESDPMVRSEHNREIIAWCVFKDIALTFARNTMIDVERSVSTE